MFYTLYYIPDLFILLFTCFGNCNWSFKNGAKFWGENLRVGEGCHMPPQRRPTLFAPFFFPISDDTKQNHLLYGCHVCNCRCRKFATRESLPFRVCIATSLTTLKPDGGIKGSTGDNVWYGQTDFVRIRRYESAFTRCSAIMLPSSLHYHYFELSSMLAVHFHCYCSGPME